MEQAILMGCVAAPAIVSLAFLLLATFVARKRATWSDPVAAVIVSIGWCTAVASTLVMRQDLDWSAPEAWQMILIPIMLSAVAWALTVTPKERGHEFRWVVVSMGSLVTAMFAMPGGDERRDHEAVEVSPGRLAMGEENRVTRRGLPLIDVGHAKAFDIEVPRRVVEALHHVEAFYGGSHEPDSGGGTQSVDGCTLAVARVPAQPNPVPLGAGAVG